MCEFLCKHFGNDQQQTDQQENLIYYKDIETKFSDKEAAENESSGDEKK